MVQQIVQQRFHHQAGVGDQFGVLARSGVRAAHLGRSAQDRADGGAQIMADGGEEGALLAQFAAHPLDVRLGLQAVVLLALEPVGQAAPDIQAVDGEDDHRRRRRDRGAQRRAQAHQQEGEGRHIEDLGRGGAGQHGQRPGRIDHRIDHGGRQHDRGRHAARRPAERPQNDRKGAVQAGVGEHGRPAQDVAGPGHRARDRPVQGREDEGFPGLDGDIGQAPGHGGGPAHQRRRRQAAGHAHGDALHHRAPALPDRIGPAADRIGARGVRHAFPRLAR